MGDTSTSRSIEDGDGGISVSGISDTVDCSSDSAVAAADLEAESAPGLSLVLPPVGDGASDHPSDEPTDFSPELPVDDSVDGMDDADAELLLELADVDEPVDDELDDGSEADPLEGSADATPSPATTAIPIPKATTSPPTSPLHTPAPMGAIHTPDARARLHLEQIADDLCHTPTEPPVPTPNIGGHGRIQRIRDPAANGPQLR